MTWPHVAQGYGALFTELLPGAQREELATPA
jgi:hypothetical protein